MVRLQAHVLLDSGKPSLLGILRKTINEEGFLGLYKGVYQTCIRAAVVCGVEIPSYYFVKSHLISSGLMQDTKGCHFV
ncbi:unnamed protein product [Trichobilharzia regenti]|nr:unnamed protein product [Trichobilharzia regenti]